MRYAVKVNNYYVSEIVITEAGYVSEITLSCEMMKTYREQTANFIKRLVNGELVAILDKEGRDETVKKR